MSEPRHILALDTATKIQAVSLLRDETPLEDVRHRVAFDHGSSLLTNVGEALAEHDLEPSDLDLIAVGIGPGSFTGLRISLALAKGIAIGREIPLIAVSSLEALAYPHARSFSETTVVPAYDARRDEVFCGEYVWEAGESERHKLRQVRDDRAVRASDLRDELEKRLGDDSPTRDETSQATSRPEVILVGNGPHTYDVLGAWSDPRVHVVPAWNSNVTAVAVGLLGAEAYRQHGPSDITTLEPNYIRPSSAEEAKRAGKLPEIPT